MSLCATERLKLIFTFSQHIAFCYKRKRTRCIMCFSFGYFTKGFLTFSEGTELKVWAKIGLSWKSKYAIFKLIKTNI